MDSKMLSYWVSKGAAVIRDDEWPVVARGSCRGFANGMDESQAKRWWRVDVRVRRHEDGRAIVCGVYDYYTAFSHERNFVARAGRLIDQDADLVAAIHTVGAELARTARETGHSLGMHIQAILSGSHVTAAVDDCIANLPAR